MKSYSYESKHYDILGQLIEPISLNIHVLYVTVDIRKQLTCADTVVIQTKNK